MAHIDPSKYFAQKEHRTDRPKYNRGKLLKIIRFAFMERSYSGVREIHKLCQTGLRFLWLSEEAKAPAHVYFVPKIRSPQSPSPGTI